MPTATASESTSMPAQAAPATPGPLFANATADKRDFAAALRSQTLACRVHHEKLGVRKALTSDQVKVAAESFDADGRSLTASKKLIDTRDPAYRAVANVRSRANHYWKSVTTPFPESGVRLIRKGAVEAFDAKMSAFRAELRQAANELQLKYQELRDRAREQLGSLFNPDDYPLRVDNQFELDWDYPSVEPPQYLKDLHPHLYEQECERMRGRFEEAVRLTEQALATKLQELVAHLADRLKGDVDGKPKVFKDSALKNLQAFFEEFRAVDLGSNGDLGRIVDTAQKAVAGLAPDDVRANTDVRATLGTQLQQIQEAMDGLMVVKPKRAIDLSEEG